jgi:hypothetical protein
MSGDSIKNLVNQMVSRYMGNSAQSPLALPAVNDLSVGADEYARIVTHRPASSSTFLENRGFCFSEGFSNNPS